VVATKPSRADSIYLGLSALAVVISVLKAQPFPTIDAALFEYFGWAMIHGRQFYTDVFDVKLPSIFAVNALWQWLFGQNYLLHTLAEALVNAGAIALFALFLRRWNVAAWALGTFLFAAFFTIPYPEFDYAEHYAVFLIVLGLYLSARGRPLWAGAALGLATTFWLPAALTCLPILLQPTTARKRIVLVAGLFFTLALYALVLLALFGPQYFGDVARLWSERAAAFTLSKVHVFQAPLSAAAGALALILVIAWRRPLNAAARFGLIWSVCALAGTAPDFFEPYFLPLTPAFAMTIASFGLTKKSFARRPLAWVAALLALGFLGFAAHDAVAYRTNVDRWRANLVTLGDWIRSSAGNDATIYTDDYLPELYLAAHARLPDPVSLLTISDERLNWTQQPQIVVFGPRFIPPNVDPSKRLIAKRGSLAFDPVCAGRTGTFAVFAIPSLVRTFDCAQLKLTPGS